MFFFWLVSAGFAKKVGGFGWFHLLVRTEKKCLIREFKLIAFFYFYFILPRPFLSQSETENNISYFKAPVHE